MKKILFFSFFLLFLSTTIIIIADSKKLGDRCFARTECGIQMKCFKGVCIAKKVYAQGDKSKIGKKCRINADCIMAGKCAKGKGGKKYCTGEL